MTNSKLYIIVRSDLPPGAQLAQSCHAMRAWVENHPELDAAWYRDSNNLACLQVPDRAALEALAKRARLRGAPYSLFYEPDFGGEVTAMALAPAGAPLVAQLPLALRAVAA